MNFEVSQYILKEFDMMQYKHDFLARRILLGLLLGALVWMLGMPMALDAIVIPLLFVTMLFIRVENGVLLACGIVVALGLGEVGLRILSHSGGARQNYRFDDQYFRNGHYLENVDDAMHMLHGDIAAMDPLAPAAIREQRDVRFHTDDLGYRNDRNYAGESVVLVGDSFVAGTDTDQGDILGSVLRHDFDIPTYSLGFPGNPNDYIAPCAHFLQQRHNNVRFVLFFFEGNDLSCSSKERFAHNVDSLSAYNKLKIRYANHVNKFFRLPQALFNMAFRITAKYHDADMEPTEVFSIRNTPVGFYGSYVDATLFPHCSFNLADLDKAVLSHVAMMFFIPTKYRTYRQWLPGDSRVLPVPSSGFASLQASCDRLGIPAYDLTPVLRQEAERLLPEGRFGFWRDDTHWNGAGIRAAAAFVADKLRPLEPKARSF